MKDHLPRRDFLRMSAAAAGLVAAAPIEAAPPKGTFRTQFRKALIGTPTEKTLRSWKDAGFQGMESGAWNIAPEKAADARKLAERLGMRIHSVMRAWTNFNQPKSVAGDVASVETALRAARAYGADAVLLVPCRIGGMPIPEPWEFDIEFEPKTGQVKRVVQGDNSPYQAYIDAHNHATNTSREALVKLIPTAEKTGVLIALENVWNNLWVKPAIFADFIASFDSPWLQCYFDIGNHVKYAPPEEWIRALGKLIVRCHVKDFKLNPNGHGGRFCNIRDGSVRWPHVMKQLDAIGRDELWMTVEGSGGLSVEQRSKRLDLIVAGK